MTLLVKPPCTSSMDHGYRSTVGGGTMTRRWACLALAVAPGGGTIWVVPYVIRLVCIRLVWVRLV